MRVAQSILVPRTTARRIRRKQFYRVDARPLLGAAPLECGGPRLKALHAARCKASAPGPKNACANQRNAFWLPGLLVRLTQNGQHDFHAQLVARMVWVDAIGN